MFDFLVYNENMKTPRNVKRAVIIAIYLSLLFLIGWAVYSALKSNPTCFDGKQNQGEEKIDCGGPCQPCAEEINAQDLKIIEKAFVYGGPQRYDAMAKISNPNDQYGIPEFFYNFILKDSGGNILAEQKGKSFILPSETKYLIGTNLETKSKPAVLEIDISGCQWETFFAYKKPQLNIYNKRYNLISSPAGFSEAFGLLVNESEFDFNVIKVNVILRDSSGSPLSFNSTEMRTVTSREERDFRLIWPTGFPGEVQSVEMEAEADVYNSQNFIKRYLKEGRFQEY
ncbi:MAG: hypothetical protein J7K40_04680 [candidate division Zixibacteria bacterium]|nr:hypothetical protein [candidate division Zixibacteria bacterium]